MVSKFANLTRDNPTDHQDMCIMESKQQRQCLTFLTNNHAVLIAHIWIDLTGTTTNFIWSPSQHKSKVICDAMLLKICPNCYLFPGHRLYFIKI